MAKEIFYRVGQTARELGVSSYKVRKLAESGLIPDAEFNGSQWHIPIAAIERMKREGVPPIPKLVDVDNEASSLAANQKERSPSTLLAEPSPEMIAAAESAEISGRELTVAKNRLERKRVLREETEIDDYYADREKRLQEEEAEQQRRYEEQAEADQRQRDKEAAAERRKRFISTWTEYGLRQTPYGAPREVELDIHEQIVIALGKVDVTEQEYVVRRLVDAAVQRGLKTWNTDKAKRAAVEEALSHLPYEMRRYNAWKGRAVKAAAQALAEVRPGTDRDELDALARAALDPLTIEYEHSKKVNEAIDSVRIAGANYNELAEAHELAQEALTALPVGSSDRQVALARDRATKDLADRVAERLTKEEMQRQRQRVIGAARLGLPYGISAEDEQDAINEITEALDELPTTATQKDMEGVKDEIVSEYQAEHDAKVKAAAKEAERERKKDERARKKAELVAAGSRSIFGHACQLKKVYDFQGESAFEIERRVKPEVTQILEEELSGREDEQEVVRMVYRIMKEIA